MGENDNLSLETSGLTGVACELLVGKYESRQG